MSELKKQYFNPVTDQEMAYLERNMDKLTYRQMAEYLGRNEGTIRKKITKIKEDILERRKNTLHLLALGKKP